MAKEEPGTVKTAGGNRCPICGEPTEMAYRPFCSSRCRDMDLARWLRGDYAIPGGQADANEDADDVSAGRVLKTPSDKDGEDAD